MKKALVSPNEIVIYIKSWELIKHKLGDFYSPIYSNVENGQRVAQVENAEFEVALPLHWVDCPDAAQRDLWYYNPETNQVLLKPEDAPEPDLPTT
jgi:hypothetical protein